METEYKVGDKVRIKPADVDMYRTDVQRKVRDRVGTVVGHTWPYNRPILEYPPAGRRKLFRFGAIDARYLELATD